MLTKNFRMPQGLADDLRFIQLLNSGGEMNQKYYRQEVLP